MDTTLNLLAGTLIALASVTPAMAAERAADLPANLAMEGHEVIMEVQAIGAQIYECRKQPDGTLNWAFREPIAALMRAGQTVGRHFVGPNWDIVDGGVTGKTVASAPGATPDDIPQLKLQVMTHHGAGPLADAQWVLRLHTRGGVLAGTCQRPGDLDPVTYTADYVFLR